MATLDESSRSELWGEYMRLIKDAQPWNKFELRKAIDMADDWVDANQSSFVAGLSAVVLGDATFDLTGGVAENVWTLSAHGLSVGDTVDFSAVGTGAAPYVVDRTYFVVGVPDVNSLLLSTTRLGVALAGTGTEGVDGDSSGTWTLRDRRAQRFVDDSSASLKAFLLKVVLDKRYGVGV